MRASRRPHRPADARPGSRFLERGEADLREGIAILGDSPTADRLNETVELIQFLRDETRAMMRRWQERKAALRTR
ncbi:hypothetical protein Acor_50250 [Acrocarpospora corrugata]|uniref:Uncharacterized protein n=1 Tax=Acrocarpospora corrugata TaxID=35763 RepID=A0A5M3W3U6_9ACTN|nr:hypothetical protein [Acrocarpospora corrugata]GES02959.1 hypothetical protein Acor_50250 [Acrocarpospora corrugata]